MRWPALPFYFIYSSPLCCCCAQVAVWEAKEAAQAEAEAEAAARQATLSAAQKKKERKDRAKEKSSPGGAGATPDSRFAGPPSPEPSTPATGGNVPKAKPLRKVYAHVRGKTIGINVGNGKQCVYWLATTAVQRCECSLRTPARTPATFACMH